MPVKQAQFPVHLLFGDIIPLVPLLPPSNALYTQKYASGSNLIKVSRVIDEISKDLSKDFDFG